MTAQTPRSPRATWPLLALIGAVLFASVAKTAADPDLWGHLRFGLDTLAQGGVVRTDPYAYVTTPGSWINHEWLAEVSFALAYSALGVLGLAALKTVVGVAVLGAVFARARRTASGLVGPTLVSALAAVTVLPQLHSVRPQIYTVGLLTALLLVLCAHERGRRGVLWASVPILMAWVNLHGGVLAGAGLLLAWYAGQVLERLIQARGLPAADGPGWGRRLLALLAPHELGPVLAALVATLVNPYGPELPAFLLRTATGARPEIQDWQPATLNSYTGVCYLVLLLVLAAVYLRGRQRPSLPQSAMLAVLLVVALGAQRHIALLGLAVALLAGPGLQSLLPTSLRASAPQPAPSANQRLRRTLDTIVTVLAVAMTGYGLWSLGDVRYTSRDYPVRAVQLLDAHVDEANLVTPYNWGEYVIWHLGPEIRVSMDGRRETVYSDAAYARSLAWYFGTDGWDALLDDPAADLALVEAGHATDNLMRLKPGWERVYADETAAVYARSGSALATKLRTAAAGLESPPLPETLLFP